MGNKKKNMQNNTKAFAMLERIEGPNVREFIAENMVEVTSTGIPVRPCMPIIGNVYCIDFSNTNYKPILTRINLVAWALSKKHKLRSFVHEESVYVATLQPISYVEEAMAEVGGFFVDVLETLLPLVNRSTNTGRNN